MTGRPQVYDIRDYDLQRMLNAGMSQKQIAKAYGCHPKTIAKKMQEFGMSWRQFRPDVDAVIRDWKNQHGEARH
jgi:hypothetical protein